MIEVSKEVFDKYVKKLHLKEVMLPFGTGFNYEDKSGFPKAHWNGKHYYIEESNE